MRQRRSIIALLCLLLQPAAALLPAGCSDGGGGGEGGEAAAPPEGEVRLLFTYGSEKEKWLEAVTADFNRAGETIASGERIRVETVPIGSGEAIDELLAGTREAHLTSPASAAFIELGNARSRAETGRDLIGPTDNLVLSPVVIAMWRPMARAMGWPERAVGWADILELARDDAGWASFGIPQWGEFKFGHTHPEYSNSGLISLFAEVYAASGKQGGLTLDDVRDPGTARFLAGIESAVVHYGSSTGFFGSKMFGNGPGYLSAAVLYENMVIESYGTAERPPFPVVAIYPREGTFWSDHPVGIVQRPWVGDEHREAAERYIDYLLARPRQERAIGFGFRPADPAVPLTAPFDAGHGVDPLEPQTTLEVPRVEVMDAIIQLWKENKKHSHVTLVFDTSSSMAEESRIQNARAGALQLLDLLTDRDHFTFVPFASEPVYAVQNAPLAAARERVEGRVRSVFPDGKTALYDAIAWAYSEQQAARRTGGEQRIRAIVVLTDGDDTASRLRLERVLEGFSADREGSGGIRVFTIGYSPEANREVLERIAEATRAKFYDGNPQNIRAVFREISTFF